MEHTADISQKANISTFRLFFTITMYGNALSLEMDEMNYFWIFLFFEDTYHTFIQFIVVFGEIHISNHFQANVFVFIPQNASHFIIVIASLVIFISYI